MMKQENITTGIVLRAIDWAEKDKILTVFTRDFGKISISLKGVRQQKSKLKFASFPLAYAEFTIYGNSEILSCSGAREIGSFFDLTNDYDRLIYASAMLEIVDTVSNIGEINSELFDELVNSLQALCDFKINMVIVFVRFLLYTYFICGYQINLKQCKLCKKDFSNGAILNVNTGELICKDCFNESGHIFISQNQLSVMEKIFQLNYNDITNLTISEKDLNGIEHFLLVNFMYRFNKKLKSLKK